LHRDKAAPKVAGSPNLPADNSFFGARLAHLFAMNEEKSTEEQNVKIDAIVGNEALGYEGSARGEHSGQEGSDQAGAGDALGDGLADNRPDQVK
jgi:hypothetical protein